MTNASLVYILLLIAAIFGLAFWLEYQLKKQEDAIYDTNRIDVRKYGLIND